MNTTAAQQLPDCLVKGTRHDFADGKNCAVCGLPIPAWSGDCFSRAGLEMLRNMTNGDARLVHAEVADTYRPGEWVIHAWVEMPATFEYVDDETGEESQGPGFVVIDTAQPDERAQILPREIYYEQCTPRDIKRYTFAQMVERCRKYDSDGPWED